MSLYPFFIALRPSRMIVQRMRPSLPEPEEFFAPFNRMANSLLKEHLKPWRNETAANDGEAVSIDTDKFQVSLNVKEFKPEEITVKITGSNEIVIEGKHEEKDDENGFVSRHFVRKFCLPGGLDTEKLVSKLSSDGVLNIMAPMIEKADFKEIPIEQTGKPAVDFPEKQSNEQQS